MLCRAGPFAWGRGSCLELVFARDPWRDAWLTAEEEDAQEQLGDILDRLNAWDASPSVRGSAAHPQPFQKGTNRWALPFRLRQAAFCDIGQTGQPIWHCPLLHSWCCPIIPEMQKLYGPHVRSCDGFASVAFQWPARRHPDFGRNQACTSNFDMHSHVVPSFIMCQSSFAYCNTAQSDRQCCAALARCVYSPDFRAQPGSALCYG